LIGSLLLSLGNWTILPIYLVRAFLCDSLDRVHSAQTCSSVPAPLSCSVYLQYLCDKSEESQTHEDSVRRCGEPSGAGSRLRERVSCAVFLSLEMAGS